MTVNIEFKTRSHDQLKKLNNTDLSQIEKNGDVILTLRDYDQEDDCLSSGFTDCHNMMELLEDAYNAGKNGEDWVFSSSVSDDI